MKIGIIGGGQLGMMMAEEAILLGHTIISLDPNPSCPLSYYSNKHITASYNDKDALLTLSNLCDVITYEFENVDVALVKELEQKIPQKSKALSVSQNRLREKTFAENLGIPVPRFYPYNGAIKEYPVVVKTTEGGYDGKGQYYLNSASEHKQLTELDTAEYIVEEFVAFEYEISVVITRDQYNTSYTYPITQNIHRNGILFRSLTYSTISNQAKEKAIAFSKNIIEALDYVGTLAVEYFVKGDEVIFNEFAPRPHNSGHYTIEGSTVSQFKNHILAVVGEKIQEPKLVHHSEMINILGQDMDYLHKAKVFEQASIHMYNKDKVVTNRKMGHITIVNEDLKELKRQSEAITKE